MPLDPAISDALNAQLLANSQQAAQLNGMIDRNLSQGLGVINSSLIHQQGATTDDAGLIASLQTASRVPVQGANERPA